MTNKLEGFDESAIEVFQIAEAYAKENMNAAIEPAHILKALLHKDIGLVSFIEKTLDAAARIMGNMTKDPFYDLTNQEFRKYVESAIDAHGAWLTRLKEMVNTRNILPLQQDSSKCGFGHFYYAITPKNPDLLAVWKPMEEKHRKFHNFGGDVVKALFNEDYSRADSIYREAEKYSQDLISDMKKLLSLLR